MMSVGGLPGARLIETTEGPPLGGTTRTVPVEVCLVQGLLDSRIPDSLGNKEEVSMRPVSVRRTLSFRL